MLEVELVAGHLHEYQRKNEDFNFTKRGLICKCNYSCACGNWVEIYFPSTEVLSDFPKKIKEDINSRSFT